MTANPYGYEYQGLAGPMAVDPAMAEGAGAPRGGGLGFATFLLLSGMLFIRPADMIAGLEAVPFYLMTLGLSVVVCHAAILRELSPAAVIERPMTACVVGIAGAAVLSNLVHFNITELRQNVIDCLNFLLFYLILLGVVNTQERLRTFLMWLTVLIGVQCCLGLLQYHGYIDVQAKVYTERQDEVDEETGDLVVLARLCGAGIFNNPNDLARIIIVGVILCLYWLGDRRAGMMRYLWVLPIGMFGYALKMTYSRGGLLGLMAGLAVLAFLRFGRAKSLILGAVALPVLLLAFGGRTTEMHTSEGTGHQRILLWRDAFDRMKTSPVFGIGMGHFADGTGLVAHNSFVQCYAEMGLLGGTLFTGAFYLALWGPLRRTPPEDEPAAFELRRLRPFLLAVTAGSVVGMVSSTRSYRIDTYMLLGLMAVYMRLLGEMFPALALRLDSLLVRRIAVVGVAMLLMFYVYVRVAAR